MITQKNTIDCNYPMSGGSKQQ